MSNLFDFDSQPNAGKLINSLRHLGYTNYSAIADLVDNSFDAEATFVKIYARQRDNDAEIIISDNGTGMNEAVLGQAIRLGSNIEKSEDSDLGKFGMGLCTASLSICKQTTVLTKREDGDLLKAINDVDEVVAQKKFVSFLGKSKMDESILFDEMTNNAGHGTVVILRQCDNLNNKNLTNLSNKIAKDLARIFRYFINAGRKIYVNDVLLSAIDPLDWDNPKTNKFDDSKLEISLGEVNEVMQVKLAVLAPDYSNGEKENALNMQSQGFYVMRNNREIMNGVTLGLFTKHNVFNRMRIEISFSGRLDKHMGINFTKRDVNIEQSLVDKLSSYFKGQFLTISKLVNRERATETPDDVHSIHTDVAHEIRKKSKLLMTPKAPKETRVSIGINTKTATESVATDKIRNPSQERQQEGGFAADCEFLSASMGVHGTIFEADKKGRKIIITYNSDHPFYSRFILENSRSDKRIVAGVDYLIYSLASAELLQNNDDEQIADLIGNFKSIMSSNLRTLLN